MSSASSTAVMTVPRRWSDKLDGIAWLPRLIDKARMAQTGTLGNYLFGHSPFDRALLERLGLTTAEFGQIVVAAETDDDVMAALRARGFDERRVREWSDRLPNAARFYTYLWDADEGYIKPNPLIAGCVRIWRSGLERPIIVILRMILQRP